MCFKNNNDDCVNNDDDDSDDELIRRNLKRTRSKTCKHHLLDYFRNGVVLFYLKEFEMIVMLVNMFN